MQEETTSSLSNSQPAATAAGSATNERIEKQLEEIREQIKEETEQIQSSGRCLQVLPVDNIMPLPETVNNYLLARPLYIYSTAETLTEKPQVTNFVNFYLQSVKDYITEVGYFLPDETALQESIERFDAATP